MRTILGVACIVVGAALLLLSGWWSVRTAELDLNPIRDKPKIMGIISGFFLITAGVVTLTT